MIPFEWLQLGTFIVGLLTIITALFVHFHQICEKRRDDERKEIYKKLNEFYAPFDQLRQKSSRLYEVFKGSRGDEFRTLPALLRKEDFSQNELQLLQEIISIDKQLEIMIIEKSGLIDKPDIRILLSKAATHFYIIRAASEGMLVGDVDRFISYVFPRELDDAIKQEISDLNLRLKALKK